MAARRRMGRAESMARSWLLPVALILGSTISVGSAPIDGQAERRLTEVLLTLDMAQATCGVHIVEPRLASLLSSENVTRKELYGRPVTPALQATIDALQNRFLRQPGPACADAWRRYGPSSDAPLLAR